VGDFVRREERGLAAEADLLTASSHGLDQKFKLRGLSPVLVPNAVDYDFFAGAARLPSPIEDANGPVIGYFGAVAEWLDLDLLYYAAQSRPSYFFVIVGGVFNQDISKLKALSNVQFIGNQEYEWMPAYLQGFDVCIIPHRLNALTQSSDPVKLYEYLSLGKPVVTTNLPELRRHEDLIYVANDRNEFVQMLDRASNEDDPAARERRIEFASRNTWKVRVDQFCRELEYRFPPVSIVIVTFNSERYIGPCLESIWRNSSYPNTEVIVVDNGSSDRTAQILKWQAALHPELRLELGDQNLGFPAANNVGFRKAKGDYVVFLNADTIVTPGWIGRLIRHMKIDPSIGLLCAVTNFAGNEVKVPIVYTDESSLELFAIYRAAKLCGETTELSMAPLFCAMIPRALFNEIGGLDETYGRGMFEDDDLSASVRKLGRRICVAEDCFIHHFGQASFSTLGTNDYEELFHQNRERFELKWRVSWQEHKLRPGVTPPAEDVRFEPETFCGGFDLTPR
jgi:GT2 family glycosyltransferase